MTSVEKNPTTKPGLRRRVRSLAGVGAGIVGLSLVPAITATVVLLPRPVAADQVSDLKAQAAHIAKDLVLEQLQVGTYQQLYDVDVARLRQDEAEIASSQDRIQTDVSRVNRDHKRLVSEAVSAYINLDPEVSGTPARRCSRTRRRRRRRPSTRRSQAATSPSPSTRCTPTKTGCAPNAPRSTRKRRAIKPRPTRKRPPTPRHSRRRPRSRPSRLRSPASSSPPWHSSRRRRPRPLRPPSGRPR